MDLTMVPTDRGTMETRTIGSLEVSVVGLGCNNFGGRKNEAESRETLFSAFDAGITFFDTADGYGDTLSEGILGRAFAARREQVVLATKFGGPMPHGRQNTRPEYVRESCDASLARMGTDYIDLFQLHWSDRVTPIADTLGALADLVEAGKVREIGCSNFTVEMLREARAVLSPGKPGFVSVQNEYNLLQRGAEADVLPECLAEGMAFLPYRPFFHGLLTGKYTASDAEPGGTRIMSFDEERRAQIFSTRNLGVITSLTEYAEARGHTLLQLVVGHMLANPAIPSVIAGASNPEQITSNVAAAQWPLGPDDLGAIEGILADT